ncbi:uncharacterized protein LOC110618725 isoform X1 [Manihot esculenta]|uniref:uncharacterized protein LOC110618725 isoform X1 n=2 Tax=Manihot esculenta TaxID=3983 RepID=UPI000B5D37F1|nr:uncharacterized protein LOC110618725 isoform X1 [Manihot esculenta]XP_021617641.1 uncharacterized protein LOC110618725 isoform X1 [Manihot esculenta]XP_021617642.1 uncharacterized protein LOC110618725 isoform X1 [Manihot esculenta]XP_021617644.1 uncharacterized protein LOC110618725 isoform X1 [Manihot esculenta]XP_021617645.1 uncharacterized protein LOC110618725 isoform X1 [Manihot esculenta]XP_043814226.1 uncharacterized protein LOC110618725 isoform X1 [Manihot esculenta]XP_043814227.1 un
MRHLHGRSNKCSVCFLPNLFKNTNDCGGPLHYGMECIALVTDNIGGYDVCTAIGHVLISVTSIIDERNPQKGVIVKMSNTVKTSTGSKNCSLNVSVICNSNGVQGPHSLEKLGTCDLLQ